MVAKDEPTHDEDEVGSNDNEVAAVPEEEAANGEEDSARELPEHIVKPVAEWGDQPPLRGKGVGVLSRLALEHGERAAALKLQSSGTREGHRR